MSMGFPVRIAICDDEVIYRESLKTECRMFFTEYSHESLWPGVAEISEFSTGRELIASDHDYDILFLDIEMPGQDGISVKEYFAEYHEKTRVIFMTCHDERVMEAFGKNVVSFLVKPLNSKAFRKVLKKTLDDICGRVLELEENGEPLIIPVRQIKYIEATEKYRMAVMESKIYLLRRTMTLLE
ncbi:MAG: LytTR family DNA-binding domain-containing protein, partial [Lachnospiraceae bacterium]|nr:LytTR family DNA-binding domain-containing protein [Lachnospiraceae bacterium]